MAKCPPHLLGGINFARRLPCKGVCRERPSFRIVHAVVARMACPQYLRIAYFHLADSYYASTIT
jgi:hypothetical protein